MAKEQNLKPFQKGHKFSVGHGRPRGPSLKTLFKRFGELDIEGKNPDGEIDKMSMDEWIVLKHGYKAMSGSLPHMREWYDRREGKVTNTIEVSDIRDKKAQELTTEELEGFLEDEVK